MGEIFLVSSTKSIGLSKDRGLHRMKPRPIASTLSSLSAQAITDCSHEHHEGTKRSKDTTSWTFPSGSSTFVFAIFDPLRALRGYRRGPRRPVRAFDSSFSGSPDGFAASAARYAAIAWSR